jgi:hypothetical protein
LLWKEKDELYKLVTIDGNSVKYQSGNVNMEIFSILFDVCGMKYIGYFDIMEISKYDIILRIPWLRTSNPKVNWKTGQIQWDLSGRELASIESRSRGEKSIRNSKVLRINVIIKELKVEQPVEAIPEEY